MWIIDTDHISDVREPEYCREGTTSKDFDEALFMEQDRVEWRVKDDDDEIYYEGRMTAERLNDDSERAFGPLDFAMADAGATSMEYYVDGEGWVRL